MAESDLTHSAQQLESAAGGEPGDNNNNGDIERKE